MGKAWARVISLSISFMLFGVGSGQQTMGTAEAKRAALETVEALRYTPELRPFHWPNQNGCDLSLRRVYAGKPILVRSLIQLTQADLALLRSRVKAAKRQKPDFVGEPSGEVQFAQLNHGNKHEVPIYHRTCGYMFHVQARSAAYRSSLRYSQFLPLSADEAQVLLGVARLPTLVSFESLTPQYDGHLWLSGHYAVDAFRNNRRYRIVDKQGKPVDLLETVLKPQIFAERFVTSYGQPSAYWHFRLPVRLEPLKHTPGP